MIATLLSTLDELGVSNKTDAIIINKEKQIKFSHQKSLLECTASLDRDNLLDFIHNNLGAKSIDKRAPLYSLCKVFLMRVKMGKHYYNFSDKEINFIVEHLEYTPLRAIQLLFPDIWATQEINQRSASLLALRRALGLEVKLF